ncbi:MAG: substrate-binding domain-containing protein [Promethearchaeota archaeon]
MSKRKQKAIFIGILLSIAGITVLFIYLEYKRLESRLVLATTTSTYDSGLLDYLLPVFEEKTGIEVDVLSVGTGQALEIAKKGDADVLLVHAREKEDDFIDEGYGVHRACIMYNDFIIVGPQSDPALIKNENITNTMTKLKNSGDAGTIEFYSRGDESGTHTKELELWDEINFTPDPKTDDWYIETGAGMADTLLMANENDGYTLIDRGTWLSLRDNVDLILLVEGEKILLNPYGAIAVNPEKHTNIKFENAREFISFLTSEEGQTLIGDFKKDGEILFHPCFGICDKTHDCPTRDEEVEYWSQYNGNYEGSIELLPSNLIFLNYITNY